MVPIIKIKNIIYSLGQLFILSTKVNTVFMVFFKKTAQLNSHIFKGVCLLEKRHLTISLLDWALCYFTLSNTRQFYSGASRRKGLILVARHLFTLTLKAINFT